MSKTSGDDQKAAAAAEIQKKRELEDLERHVKRIAWLDAENPTWADGSAVSAYDQRVLLTQSRDFVSRRAPAPTK